MTSRLFITISNNLQRLFLLLSVFIASAAFAQKPFKTADKYFKPAKSTEQAIYSLDPARKVVLMDATPDASHWYIADEFAHWTQMTIDGQLIDRKFHEIPASGVRLSPKGDYLIWTGLMRAYTKLGFDSTSVYLYKDMAPIGHYVADYPSIEFSHSGDRWATLLPYAYETQLGDRDFVVVDGLVVHEREISPHQFSFSHDEKHWAYRATDGLVEKLVTDKADTSIFLYKRTPLANGETWDPAIWRFTPDVTYNHRLYEGRDYDFGFTHVAKELRTAYSSISRDTAHVYMNFNDRNQPMYRWVSDVHIDDSGHHIAYFAASRAANASDSASTRQAVVVFDGQEMAGPFNSMGRLFMSSSGKHIAYSTDEISSAFYLDKKLAAKTNQILDCVWSPDESHAAFITAGEHNKEFVVVDGKRSGLYEWIGRIEFSPDSKSVEFAGIRGAKLYKVRVSR
jgi:hypothetical protein